MKCNSNAINSFKSEGFDDDEQQNPSKKQRIEGRVFELEVEEEEDEDEEGFADAIDDGVLEDVEGKEEEEEEEEEDEDEEGFADAIDDEVLEGVEGKDEEEEEEEDESEVGIVDAIDEIDDNSNDVIILSNPVHIANVIVLEEESDDDTDDVVFLKEVKKS